MKPLRSEAPPTSILSPRFKYTSAAATDIRATFERLQQKAEQQQAANVRPIKRKEAR